MSGPDERTILRGGGAPRQIPDLAPRAGAAGSGKPVCIAGLHPARRYSSKSLIQRHRRVNTAVACACAPTLPNLPWLVQSCRRSILFPFGNGVWTTAPPVNLRRGNQNRQSALCTQPLTGKIWIGAGSDYFPLSTSPRSCPETLPCAVTTIFKPLHQNKLRVDSPTGRHTRASRDHLESLPREHMGQPTGKNSGSVFAPAI